MINVGKPVAAVTLLSHVLPAPLALARWINFFFVFMCCGHVAEAILVWRLGARLRLRRPGRWGLATLFFGMPATMLFTSLYLAQRRG